MSEDPTKRSCAACGEQSPATASFCWKCYTPFQAPVAAGVVPSMATIGTYQPMGRPGFNPPPAPVPAPPVATTRSIGGLRLVVGLVVGLLAAFLTYRAISGGNLTLPDSVDGAPRIENQTSELIKEQMAEIDTGGADVQVEIYGSASLEYLLFAFEGRPVEDADQMMDAFLAGATQGGATFSAADIQPSTHGDAEVRCIQIAAAMNEGAACLWRSDSSSGALLATGKDVEQTRALTGSIYDDLT